MDSTTFPFEQYGPGLSTPWYPPFQNSNAPPVENQDPNLLTATSTEGMGTNHHYHPSMWMGELDCRQPCMSGAYSVKSGCADLTTSSSPSPSSLYRPSLFSPAFSTSQCTAATTTTTTGCEEEEEARQNSFKRMLRSSASADGEEERDATVTGRDKDIHGRPTFSSSSSTVSVQEDPPSFLPAHSTVSAVALCKEIAAYLQHHPQHRWEDDPTIATLLRHAMSQLPKDFSQQFSHLLSLHHLYHHLTPPPAPPLALTWHGTGSESFTASGKRQREEDATTLGSSTSSTGLHHNRNGEDNRWRPEHAGGYFGCVETGCRGGAAWSGGAGFCPQGEGVEAFWKRLRVEAAHHNSAAAAAAAVPSCHELNAASSVVEVMEEGEVGVETEAGTPALRSSLQKSAQDSTEMVDRYDDMEDAFLTGRKRVRAQPVVEFVSLGRRLE